MLFPVTNREEIVDIVMRVCPWQVAESMSPGWLRYRPPPEGFDAMLKRASIAAVRITSGPPRLKKGEHPAAIEWAAKDYLRRLVWSRDEFAARASRIKPKPRLTSSAKSWT